MIIKVQTRMQFKHPEILYFLFLLIIPILVHLFQLRRFKKEYFTNVQFLTALSIQTRKSSKLKKWLLLVTRLLILTFIILAFAQPFFEAKNSNEKTNEMFIVLDNSFSMQAKGKKGELLKRAIEDLLTHVPENQNFSLITNAENFWNTDIKSIRKELQSLKYSATPFELDNVIAKIKSRKSAYNKDVIIITDAIDLKEKQLKSIDNSLKTFFVVPEAEQKNNMAIDSVYINQSLDKFYEISIKLSVYGDGLKETPVTLYNNDKLIAKALTKFEGRQKTVNFTIPKAPFNGFVAIEDNGLLYDNTLYFSISNTKNLSVLSIGDSEKSIFLSKIYNDKEFKYSNFEVATLDYNLLEKQDAIILNELDNIPQALQTTLKVFVEKGGNVVIIPSLKNDLANLNGFLGNFGNLQFRNIETKDKLITKIAFNHPLYEGVFEKKVDNFQYPNTKASFVLANNNAAVLSYEDQASFLSAIQKPLGALYVFSAPINKQNSNFQNAPLIVPTFYKMVQNAQKTGVSALTIGKNKPLIVDANIAKDEIINLKNTAPASTESFIPVQQILNDKVKLTFYDMPQEAGNFAVLKEKEFLKHISFNYDRTESNLVDTNKEFLSDYNTIESIESVFDKIQSDRTDDEIWKWFAIFTLLFLIVELLVQKFVK